MDSLGDRMKGYEVAARQVLPRRMPVILRIDGKAFHTYASDCEKPFDKNLSDVMLSTTKELCRQIQGTQLGYTQSDEISILIHGYKKFDSQPWFDNQLMKMVSVAAGIASSHFTAESWRIWHHEDIERFDAISPAVFDCRAFVIPESDVCNYFLWRQQDAMRNSVQMLARSLYNHKQCDSKNVIELKEMCAAKGMPWDKMLPRYQKGMCYYREPKTPYCSGGGCYDMCQHDPNADQRGTWRQDENIPLFNVNRDYINDLLKLEEE
jgi:tRNA(His) 5'-end guanylyltransferase